MLKTLLRWLGFLPPKTINNEHQTVNYSSAPIVENPPTVTELPVSDPVPTVVIEQTVDEVTPPIKPKRGRKPKQSTKATKKKI